MLRSMTGYGRGESTLGDRTVMAEIKSVNNRYRDIIVRLPKTLQSLEDEVRSRVASRMRRGRVEVLVQFNRRNGQTEYALDLNLPLARSYYQILRRVCEEFGLEGEIRAEELCQMRDVIAYKPEEENMEEVGAGLRVAVDKALDSWDTMRLHEGKVIEEDLAMRLGNISEHVDRIEEISPLVLEEYRKRLRDKVSQMLPGRDVDEGLLAQEVVFFSDRSDITEEIVRAKSHLAQFRKALTLDDALGRKLDFLTQEIHREVNTMSSKASVASISATTVDIKVEIEKMREQIQNVE
ncbi:MAG: YicC family protein [Deltaproteobacteria bacterium]|nr:YicC family protein [Deltaproteobacteria bacterium]